MLVVILHVQGLYALLLVKEQIGHVGYHAYRFKTQRVKRKHALLT